MFVAGHSLLRQPAFVKPSLRLLAPTASPSSIRMFALTPYRASQPKTLSNQDKLPRLPVPDLQASLERYLKSLKPVLMQLAKQQGRNEEEYVDTQLARRREWAVDFAKKGGLGRVLQERLIDVDRAMPNNWLDDAFWLKMAYHGWRVPLPINSNWWILMADDTNVPEPIRTLKELPPQGEYTDWQIKRAAKLTHRMMEFKRKMDSEELMPDSSRAGPFCMHQYTRMFGLTRIPSLPTDFLADSPHPHPAKHIIVMAQDNMYSLDVDGSSLNDIEADLWAIVEDAKERGTGPKVGICSGDGRDAWAVSREHLVTLDPVNRESLKVIEDSLFVVSLDNLTRKSKTYKSSSPKTQTPDLDAHILTASVSGGTGQNRWWDKALALNIESNGRAAMIGEHSPCDALIPSILADFVLAEGIDPSSQSQRGKSPAKFTPLSWVLDDKARDNIVRAQRTIEALAKDSDAHMLWYDEYGAEWIKKVGKQSPDAYLQMALQLAFRKTQGEQTPTYETASTRLFKHGRTDVIRTFSEDSYRFVEAMTERKAHSPTELYALLTAATKAHNAYTRDSSVGKGCDRHFLGLKALMREGESHPLFDDELFGQSQSWVLSTSGLSAGDRFYGTGFGTVWPNGYGCNYLAGSKIIKFGLESKHSVSDTSTDNFRWNLVEAMREMREVCEQGQDAAPAPEKAGQQQQARL